MPQFIWKGTRVKQVEQQQQKKKKQALMKCPKSEIQNPKNAISRKQAMESPRKKTEEKNKTEDEPVWFTTKCEQRG